jgi:hypothetical protein
MRNTEYVFVASKGDKPAKLVKRNTHDNAKLARIRLRKEGYTVSRIAKMKKRKPKRKSIKKGKVV